MRFAPYILDGHSPLEHLAFEELLLRNSGGRALLLFYVNSPSVLIGRNQNPWREVSEACQLPLFRRTSGGGTVYHDEGNLNWAFIVPRDAHDREAELKLMAGAVTSLGREVAPGQRGGLFLSGAGTGAGAKVSGTARRIGAASVLHHGTLLLAADLAALASSLGGLVTSEDSSLTSVSARPANLSNGSLSLTPLEAVEALSLHLTGRQAEPLSSGTVDSGAFADVCGMLGSDSWIYGKTPPFALELAGRDGKTRLKMLVKEGRVERIESDSPGLEEALARHSGELFSFRLAKELSLLGGS